MDYQKLIKELETITLDAAKFMVGHANRTSQNKTSERDFVTVADIKSQDLITKRLGGFYPGVTILSEELSPEMQKKVYDTKFTGFVIDPIDGTFNFKRDMHESGISIGYVENGEPQAGVIYDPYRLEMYTVVKGRAALRNGKPIHVSDQADIAGASITTSNSYDDEAMARNLKRHLAIFEQTGTMPWTNCTGSGVLIMTYIACGRMDIYHHNGLKPWDNPVAFLLIREAGGRVLTLKGEEASFTSPTILTGNPALVQKIQEVFAHVPVELLQ